MEVRTSVSSEFGIFHEMSPSNEEAILVETAREDLGMDDIRDITNKMLTLPSTSTTSTSEVEGSSSKEESPEVSTSIVAGDSTASYILFSAERLLRLRSLHSKWMFHLVRKKSRMLLQWCL